MSYPFALPPQMVDAMRAADAREAREWELQQLERQDRAWAAAQMNEVAEHDFQYQHGCSSSEYREAMSRIALQREGRDLAGEYGSQARPAVRMGNVELKPVERSQRGPWVRDPEAELLKRARNVDPDGFMAEQVRRFDARRGGKRTISRSEVPETIECLDCIEDGHVTVDEYLAIHSGPDAIPIRTVPDHVPASRNRSGGRKIPMIYR